MEARLIGIRSSGQAAMSNWNAWLELLMIRIYVHTTSWYRSNLPLDCLTLCRQPTRQLRIIAFDYIHMLEQSNPANNQLRQSQGQPTWQ